MRTGIRGSRPRAGDPLTPSEAEARQTEPAPGAETPGAIPPDVPVTPNVEHPDRQTAAELSAAVAQLVDELRAIRPEPLQSFLGLADPGAGVTAGTFYTERVPLRAMWQIGHVTVDPTSAGTVAIYLDAVAPDRLVAAQTVAADGTLITFTDLWLREAQRLVIVVTSGAGEARYASVFGHQRMVT